MKDKGLPHERFLVGKRKLNDATLINEGRRGFNLFVFIAWTEMSRASVEGS